MVCRHVSPANACCGAALLTLFRRVKPSRYQVCVHPLVWRYIPSHELRWVATDKSTETGGNDKYYYAVSEMQGWRISECLLRVTLHGRSCRYKLC